MNFVKLRGLSAFRTEFVYVDIPEYVADQLFIKHKVRVHFKKGEMHRPGDPYVVVFCSVRKKDINRFMAAMEEMPEAMRQKGHEDYTEYCEKYLGVIGGNSKNRTATRSEDDGATEKNT